MAFFTCWIGCSECKVQIYYLFLLRVKSPLDEIWPEHMFIGRGGPCLTSQFCKDAFGPTGL